MSAQQMTTPPRSAYRFFPHAMIALLLTVVLVNIGMMWSATKTFPGVVNDNAFDTSNSYNAVLDAAQRQAALGWQLDLAAMGTKPSIVLRDRAGQPLHGLSLQAVAQHPVGPADQTKLNFVEDGDRYVAREALPGQGQWQVEIAASAAGGPAYRVTRRLLVP